MPQYIHRRNIRFKNKIAVADKSKILGVAIDPSSNFHRVVIFNFLGEIKGKQFSINTLKSGYDLLVKNINRLKKSIKATDVYIAIESAGSYSENLIRCLYEDFSNVFLVTPLAVSDNRKQKSLLGLKTDDTDCGVIGDLLIRGEFTQFVPENLVYYKLKNLIYWRAKKIIMMVMLKNQIAHRTRRCFPGINCDFENNKPLYTKEENLLYQGLINNYMTGQEYLRSSDQELFARLKYTANFTGRGRRIKEFKERLNSMFLPRENFSRIHLDIMSIDVKLLKLIKNEVDLIEKEIVNLGKQTSAIHIMNQIKGISELSASSYVGLIGDIKKYKSAGNIFSYSGLSPKIEQSGASSMSKAKGIKRAGNKLLRSLLFNISKSTILNEPYFKSYYQKIKREKKRSGIKNIIAVSNKLNRVLFALIRDGAKFKREGADNSGDFIIATGNSTMGS
jgi:transposase